MELFRSFCLLALIFILVGHSPIAQSIGVDSRFLQHAFIFSLGLVTGSLIWFRGSVALYRKKRNLDDYVTEELGLERQQEVWTLGSSTTDERAHTELNPPYIAGLLQLHCFYELEYLPEVRHEWVINPSRFGEGGLRFLVLVVKFPAEINRGQRDEFRRVVRSFKFDQLLRKAPLQKKRKR